MLTVKFKLQGDYTGQKLKHLDGNDRGEVTDVPQNAVVSTLYSGQIHYFDIRFVLYIFDTRVIAKISSSETYVQSSRYNMCTHRRPNVRLKTKRFSSIERWPTRVRIDVDIGDKIGLCEKNTAEQRDKKNDPFNCKYTSTVCFIGVKPEKRRRRRRARADLGNTKYKPLFFRSFTPPFVGWKNWFLPTPCLIGKLIVQQRPSVVDRVLNLVRLLAYTTNAANGRRAE